MPQWLNWIWESRFYMMDDVISLSSGSEEDSDIEFVSSYRDDSAKGIPFIRAELLPVTPVLIDITEHCFSSDRPRSSQTLKKQTRSTIEIIDLNNVSESYVKPSGKVRSSYTVNLETDVICLDSGDANGDQSPLLVSCDQDNSYINRHNVVHCQLQDNNTQRSGNLFHHSRLNDISGSRLTFDPPNEVSKCYEAQNTNHTQQTLPGDKNPDREERLESPHSWLSEVFSPFSITSPYYCPSELDVAVFSDESLILYDDDKDQKYTTFSIDKSKSTFDVCKCMELQERTLSPYAQTQSQIASHTLPTSDRAPTPVSPTSTELLAGDSPKTVSDLDMESPPISPVRSCHTLSSPSHLGLGIKDGEDDGGDEDLSEHETEGGQQISVVQFKKLKYLLGDRVQNMHVADEDNKDFGMAEPLCRQSLSLVYSTIEENYTEGTLQLLSDLIQPCYYPPADITTHLLRGILLEPQRSRVLALEAYNLLMRTQKYHPADRLTISWDWELLSSVMAEQDETRKLHCEVRCLLLQYVLQVLEDDFQFKLSMLRLHLSIANEMLSCDYRIRAVRELVSWLLDAAQWSVCTTEDEEMKKRDRNCCLKMLLILQRMLLLAMEVDLRPTCSSSKLSQELCNRLNSMAPCRRLRFLLLNTLQSNLMRCKIVELLLDQSCSQKRVLPMSFKLLLHFLHTSTLAPDPTDGAERWRRWDELLQLVWMLMLSYQEVITGHLRYSITERFKVTRTPMWTQNDQVTQAAVQEAAQAFLSRATEDLGHDLPSQIQESLSQLQEHLLSISLQ